MNSDAGSDQDGDGQPPADSRQQPFATLTPERLFTALAAAGFYCDGRLQALNSYENRVYALRSDDGERLVVKFYRPQRWSDAQIREEHAFLRALDDAGVPVITPQQRDGSSLFIDQELRFAVFPHCAGRPFEADNDAQLAIMGRTVGRLHLAARTFTFQHRPRLDVQHYARPALAATLDSAHLPAHLAGRYRALAEQTLILCEQVLTRWRDIDWISAHGDLHPGNILWTGDGVLLADFDDARCAPAVQDLWMLADTPGARDLLISEYESFCDFDWREWQLVNALRTLRLLHHTGWLASRWSDPTFPRHFPWFAASNYFPEQLALLQEQLDALQDDA